MNLVYEKANSNIDNISIKKFSIKINDKKLFDESDLVLSKKSKYGLIGKNGCGKTTLLKTLINNKFKMDNKMSMIYVEQEIEETDLTPVDFILKSNKKLIEIKNKLDFLENKMNNEELNDEEFNQYDELSKEIENYDPEKQKPIINKILNGLGFTKESITNSCNTFSGGWKMRISLAKALYMKPDILLLTEPTNHLDLEAVIWLTDYLNELDSIILLVSHNVGLLNDVCTNILNIENYKIVNYKGNYDKFKLNYNKKLREIEKKYNKYEKSLNKMKKSGKKTKKEINEFIKNNKIDKPKKNQYIRLEFEEVKNIPSNLVNVENVYFSYDNQKIFNDINFGLSIDSRITLVGKNGSGKSTLFKLLHKKLKPNEGYIMFDNRIKIGYYDQHFENNLPLDKTPVEYLIEIILDNLINNDNLTNV